MEIHTQKWLMAVDARWNRRPRLRVADWRFGWLRSFADWKVNSIFPSLSHTLLVFLGKRKIV